MVLCSIKNIRQSHSVIEKFMHEQVAERKAEVRDQIANGEDENDSGRKDVFSMLVRANEMEGKLKLRDDELVSGGRNYLPILSFIYWNHRSETCLGCFSLVKVMVCRKAFCHLDLKYWLSHRNDRIRSRRCAWTTFSSPRGPGWSTGSNTGSYREWAQPSEICTLYVLPSTHLEQYSHSRIMRNLIKSLQSSMKQCACTVRIAYIFCRNVR